VLSRVGFFITQPVFNLDEQKLYLIIPYAILLLVFPLLVYCFIVIGSLCKFKRF
jgi:hypothetical protein